MAIRASPNQDLPAYRLFDVLELLSFCDYRRNRHWISDQPSFDYERSKTVYNWSSEGGSGHRFRDLEHGPWENHSASHDRAMSESTYFLFKLNRDT